MDKRGFYDQRISRSVEARKKQRAVLVVLQLLAVDRDAKPVATLIRRFAPVAIALAHFGNTTRCEFNGKGNIRSFDIRAVKRQPAKSRLPRFTGGELDKPIAARDYLLGFRRGVRRVVAPGGLLHRVARD